MYIWYYCWKLLYQTSINKEFIIISLSVKSHSYNLWLTHIRNSAEKSFDPIQPFIIAIKLYRYQLIGISHSFVFNRDRALSVSANHLYQVAWFSHSIMYKLQLRFTYISWPTFEGQYHPILKYMSVTILFVSLCVLPKLPHLILFSCSTICSDFLIKKYQLKI